MTTVLDTVLQAEQDAATMLAAAEAETHTAITAAHEAHSRTIKQTKETVASNRVAALMAHEAKLVAITSEAAKKTEAEVAEVSERFTAKKPALVTLVTKHFA